MEQIAAKVAELCGYEEGEVDEPLSSFGLTSISVAELGAFIQSEFNYRVSALELMTTASSLSLAQSIIHGRKELTEDDHESGLTEATTVSQVSWPRARRTPSSFANAPKDHLAPTRATSSLRAFGNGAPSEGSSHRHTLKDVY